MEMVVEGKERERGREAINGGDGGAKKRESGRRGKKRREKKRRWGKGGRYLVAHDNSSSAGRINALLLAKLAVVPFLTARCC